MFSLTAYTRQGDSTRQGEDGVPLEFYDGPTHIGNLMLCPSGAACTNRDCMYAHVSLLPASEGEEHEAAPRAPRAPRPPRPPCRYGMRCNRPGCLFPHPQLDTTEDQEIGSPRASRPPCRYGERCNRPGCLFPHPHHAPAEYPPIETESFPDAPRRSTTEEVEVEGEIFTEGARRAAAGDPPPNDPRARRPCKNGSACRGKNSGRCPYQH